MRRALFTAPRVCAARRWRSSCGAGDAAEAGLGVGVEVAGVSRAALIKAMMNHIDMPERFAPSIVHCSVRMASGPAADDGALWRSLTYDDGRTVLQHAYASPADGEIRFVGLEEGGREGALEVVNALSSPPGATPRLEHFQRDRTTLERVHWAAPRAAVAAAIDATVRLALAADEAAADLTFHPKEFPS